MDVLCGGCIECRDVSAMVSGGTVVVFVSVEGGEMGRLRDCGALMVLPCSEGSISSLVSLATCVVDKR